jgi:cytoskeletal protein CcmA (bactofilin family)
MRKRSLVFQTPTGDVQGPLEVRSLVKVDGTVHGGVIVTGGRFELDGTCRGPLEVRLDGQADVHGIVEGDVHARGGRLRLSGVVKGRLGVKDGADVLVAVGTVLNGRQLLPDGSFAPLPGAGDYYIPKDAAMLRPNESGPWTPEE